VAVEHESELVVRGLQAMLAPHSDSIILVPSRSGEGRMYDLTLYEPARGREADGTMRPPAATRPGVRVAYSWDCSHATVSTEMSRGAAGYISKWVPAARLVHDLLQIQRGRVVVDVLPGQGRDEHADTAWPLTDRETEVLTLIATGLSNQEITDRLHLSINSVKSYIRSVYGKIEVSSRSQAVLWAVRHGLLLRDSDLEAPVEAVAPSALQGGRPAPVRSARPTPVRPAPVGSTPVRSAVGSTPVRPTSVRPRPVVRRSA
jgi:DNA-binding NarL/FixJ family response regulator